MINKKLVMGQVRVFLQSYIKYDFDMIFDK